jgi:dTDP-4-amino-4,6-dideoxygalactose transaminase
LDIAMAAAQVGEGDDVVTTPIRWISTANAAAKLGGNPRDHSGRQSLSRIS